MRKREELGGCDPVLLEKTIHAFALLDALATRGLEFVFKGGTRPVAPTSADPSPFCPLTWTFSAMSRQKNSTGYWLKSGRTPPFTGMTEDDRGEHRIPARRHFKFSYTPLDAKNPAPFVLP